MGMCVSRVRNYMAEKKDKAGELVPAKDTFVTSKSTLRTNVNYPDC